MKNHAVFPVGPQGAVADPSADSTRAAQPPVLAGSRELNKFFKALSDETRRSILHLLEKREFTVGEIVANFELSQPTISRHLSVLKEANLVSDQRRGQHVVYRLTDETLARSVNKFFGGFSQCQQILRDL